MVRNPIRRAQLIAPFGVGAMMVVKNGTSLISGGLDHWYKYEDGKNTRAIDQDEFRVEEWRLQRLLNVDHFRLPPDYRDRDVDEKVPNKYLQVPFLRFPQWHFCPGCKRLYQLPLTIREKPKCPACEENKKKRFLTQVPFVAMCHQGHIQDFPWTEWVHRSVTPSCTGRMRIIATGGASLSAQIVKCECGMERSLAQITTEGTLHEKLDNDGRPYMCQGKRPWLGTEDGSSCGASLRGSLRSASNLYYADVRSAIYLPRGNNEVPAELVTLLEEPPLSSAINLLSGLSQEIEPYMLRKIYSPQLQSYTNAQVKGAIQIVTLNSTGGTDLSDTERNTDETEETLFRREEFEVLRKPRNEETLVIKESPINHYAFSLDKYFSRINLISKLKETRVLAGFTRILPENSLSTEDRKALLRSNLPSSKQDNWLPAYVVYGEGIFLEFNEKWLQIWEVRRDVSERVYPLIEQYRQLVQNNKVRQKSLGARFVLLHTFAHLLINRLTFECGYGAAALRERLYISDKRDAPMAGLLIYTAAGDSEGTMGGLVRIGQPGKLEPILKQALLDAHWCSADPVCMETGLHNRRGTDFYNLAACHNCALIPETACEEFNRFLDRALVIGKVGHRELGYFDINIHARDRNTNDLLT